MASDVSVSTRASLISLDPAVASHITGTTGATTLPSTSQYGSSPRKSTKTPDTEISRRHVRNNSAPSTSIKKRSNSLRRVKNSTEILRQRSTKGSRNNIKPDIATDVRGGRNFTVGNVGTGGILYLTPSAYQSSIQYSTTTSPGLIYTPVTAPALLGQENSHPPIQETNLSTLSNPALQPRSASPLSSTKTFNKRTAIASHGRSQSFSMVEEQRPSLSTQQSRTLRIVIQRPDAARPSTARELVDDIEEELSPTLAVPIPHYRIGSFRFSAQGTPVLRSSSFTRVSATPSDVTPTAASAHLDQYMRGPPPSSLKAFAKLDPTQSSRSRSQAPSDGDVRSATISESSIQPSIFADLNTVYDDPSVVRYCHNVREITAATPARIIAQISSDSFMDYELVSDFFLTFRCYMSTYSVLDHLLARLRWAIGRLEDDGRIIRVRTFAALRHWILNYFMDDFFMDRQLRQRFCTEVNKLYADVKNRPGSGFSDLKLLRDLKRCWNGRCSLCWDNEHFQLDGDQDSNLIPGGADDDEFSPKPEPPGLAIQLPAETPRPEVLQGRSTSWFDTPPSNDKSQLPQHPEVIDALSPSLASDGSLQATSCFPKILLRPPNVDEVHSKGPHPVSVQLRRKNAPANLQVNTQQSPGAKSLGHKRGASSIDSNRENTPRKVEADPLPLLTDGGSLIRGLVYSPSAPFVQILSSEPPSTAERIDVDRTRTRPGKPQDHPNSTQQSGRNLLGSLRKVLGGKYGSGDGAILSFSQSAHDVAVSTQNAQTPLNLSKSHDELRKKSAGQNARKTEVRIDLLCAAVCQNYESQFPSKHRITYGPLYASNAGVQLADEEGWRPRTARVASRTTTQSGSILIVDDTRPDLPVMSGALRMMGHFTGDSVTEPQPELPILQPRNLQSDLSLSRSAVVTQRSSDVLGDAIHATDSSGSSDTLDKLATGAVVSDSETSQSTSGQAGLINDPTNGDIDEVKTVDASSENLLSKDAQAGSLTSSSKLTVVPDENDPDPGVEAKQTVNQRPPPTLKRRPGGDLRTVEHVQELDHSINHQSLDTASVVSDLSQGSLLIMRTDTNRTMQKSAQPPTKVVSMINTHSSQHLRPSFEAAVAGFSDIPDDDDGGLEATLLKLEGRYEKKSPPIGQHPIDIAGKRRSLPDLQASSEIDLRQTKEASSRSLDGDVREVGEPLSRPVLQDGNIRGPSEVEVVHTVKEIETSSRKSSIYGLRTESVADSEESYVSLPLLKREAAHASTAAPAVAEPVPQVSYIAPGYFPQDPPQLFHLPKGPPPSGGKNANRYSFPRPETANESAQSFLLDEDENLSDLSSEISVDIINYSEVMDRSNSPLIAAPGTAISGLEIPAHPLTYASVVNLNIPDVTIGGSQIVSDAKESDTSSLDRLQKPVKTHDAPEKPGPTIAQIPPGPAHLPFVLACDSQILAQQMTLVEKSALAEVEWSDLVEMRWDSKAAEVLDWVDCLLNSSIRGVDMVITRFNLVVKWAMSEIVLTRDIEERARVITKYIHVAAHARRLHNYATMLQLTIALTSTDCTRLTQTWELVSAPDMSLLKHMELLVQPIRNFHDLRLEMESADPTDGCIPFIGLYVHDLTYNAQKPARVSGGPGTEPLINFERYRTCAIIVKGLLRLIDASTRYNFEPVPGVIERCLWMATLPDDGIRSASKTLEP